MEIIYKEKLNAIEKNDIWNLLILCDREFIPSLSGREGVTQSSFNSQNRNDEVLPHKYFEAMLKEEVFIMIKENRSVVGFLSYIPNREMELEEGHTLVVDYVSTVIVHPSCRNSRLTRKMYHYLIQNCDNSSIVTRTWSTNTAHLHILNSIGFKVAKTIIDGRGKGIDTVFLKYDK